MELSEEKNIMNKSKTLKTETKKNIFKELDLQSIFNKYLNYITTGADKMTTGCDNRASSTIR